VAGEKELANRIVFPGNPWPKGHAIAEFEWSGRLEADGVWFDLHLESADYDAESEGANQEDAGNWVSTGVWRNYHSCILSSTYWDNGGFLAGASAAPLDFETISERLFESDPFPVDFDQARPFGIYLQGHDTVADHRIRFTPRPDGKFRVDWVGAIALTYRGRDEFEHEFRAGIDDVTFAGIRMPKRTTAKSAVRKLAPFVTDAQAWRTVERDGALWCVRG